MNLNKFFEPKESLRLFEYNEKFEYFKDLILKNKLPKIILLTGEKGIGKSTFVNHIMHYYYDRQNYDQKNMIIQKKSIFNTQFKENLFHNIIYLNGSIFQNTKIEDIRKLKNDLLKTTIDNEKRFIILDEVEMFNLNSLNALLKLIEEPGNLNHFILINNKSKNLLETIKSRCLEIRIIMTYKQKDKILNQLVNLFNQKIILDKNKVITSPGNFLKFNNMFFEDYLNIKNDLFINLKNVLNFYKKEKDLFYKDLSFFLIEYYLQKERVEKEFTHHKFIEKRSALLKNINDYFLYNLNQNTLFNTIEGKI